jgi:hypothetical protein
MRARMIPVEAPDNAIDVCGTGGDGHHTLNVSTAVSLVVAACGVPVAKHGNRAASSKAGAADTLEALGLNLANAGARASETLSDIGIAFLFAQTHHPTWPHRADPAGAGAADNFQPDGPAGQSGAGQAAGRHRAARLCADLCPGAQPSGHGAQLRCFGR